MTQMLPKLNWETIKNEHRATLWRLLGDLPPLFTPDLQLMETTEREGFTVHKTNFDNGAGSIVPGYLILPEKLPAPAIVYLHAHGGKYDIGKEEVFQDRFNIDMLPGIELARAGYIVLTIDAYGFGERSSNQPGIAPTTEPGRETETSLFKHFLWEGKTLWGMIVRDDLLALNALLARPEVDAGRVGATGMSLGGSRTTWLAALDERVKVAVPVAQMTRYHNFAARGEYDRHSIYYYLPGVLKSGLDMEHIAALTAPRPQRILIGNNDPLSPFEGVRIIDDFAREIYVLYNASDRFETVVYDGVEHQYTPEMFIAMLDWFRQHL